MYAATSGGWALALFFSGAFVFAFTVDLLALMGFGRDARSWLPASVPLDVGATMGLTMRPLIDAHRGECGISGLPAAERYRRAIAMGVDFVEVDIRRSADGEFFSYHDDLSPSGRALRDLTSSAVGTELGAEVLKVGDLMRMLDGKVGMHVDVKEEGYEADVVRFIHEGCPPGSQVVFTSGEASVRTIKAVFPNVRAGLSLGNELEGASPWRYAQVRWGRRYPRRRLERSGADFTAVERRVARLRVLDYCAGVGMPAWVWTVNREEEIEQFMRDPRVAVLITDRPDVALRYRAGLETPTPAVGP